MKPFLNADFLLENRTSKILYFDYAADMPVIDYHNHLPPDEIAGNRRFNNITEAWLEGDHYKWRAMRANGIDEKYITGNASPREKFLKWSETVPYTMGNPLYHWTHLELQRYFGINTLLDPSSAAEIYDDTSGRLAETDMSARGLLDKMNVRVVCTTDDPADDLEHHLAMANQNPVMLPAFRPDKIFAINDTENFTAYVEKLAAASDMTIKSIEDLLNAYSGRIDFFDQHGCRLSDHGLEHLYPLFNDGETADAIFQAALNKKPVSEKEKQQFTMFLLAELCKMYHKKGWVQQFHLGALRNNNQRMLKTLGPDTGFDSIGDYSQAVNLSAFLDYLDSTDQLAKTILYNLNPGDNEMMATMAGNFNDGSVAGKVQYGSAWWFLDQMDGMEKQLTTLANMGLLSRFIGMLTDSRSFLSFPRHEYFRRILCNMLGKQVESGQLPEDTGWIGKLIRDICYNNAVTYFSLEKELN